MNDNGKPTGPIRATAGRAAQESRQRLDSLLGGIVASKEEINRRALAEGKTPPCGSGLTIHEQNAPILIAAHAVCAHLHHLTVKLEELRQDLSLATDVVREGFSQVITNTFTVEEQLRERP